ncbi:MAG: ribose-5-phosphate isomerase RpiA [Nitrosopumilaceae archaeon]
MSFDDAVKALSIDALKFVKDGQVIGLGSGRAATAFVKSLSTFLKEKKINVRCIPTSLQIKITAEQGGIKLIEADQVDTIDVVFDGADQIDTEKNMIKGGGGALLRENILISAAKKVVIMADRSKFVKKLDRAIPVEVHPLARNTITNSIKKLDGKPAIRTIEHGYPFVTENGNIILDCDFGIISKPHQLAQKIKQMPGVLEVGIFSRKPDVIYKANTGGKFEIIT